MAFALPDSAVDRFINAGGTVIKRFDIAGTELTGLVLRPLKQKKEVIAYTNSNEDYIIAGILMMKTDELTEKYPPLDDSPLSYAGLSPVSYNHMMEHTPDALGKQDARLKVDNTKKSSAIVAGIKTEKEKYNFLGEVSYISDGNKETGQSMYILYDTNCGYCKNLYTETRGLTDKYHFKWVPIDVFGDAKGGALDLSVGKLYSDVALINPKQKHLDLVAKNTRIIKDTGFIESATPTAIVYDDKEKRYKVAQGISSKQIAAFFEYLKNDK